MDAFKGISLVKRSPLTRRTPLKRGGFLRRTIRLRTRPKPAMPLSEREAKLTFEAACYGKPCAVCGARERIDAHHVLPKQRIKRRILDWDYDAESHALRLARLLWDARNTLPLCRDCHDANHTRSRPVPRHLIPEQAWEFAAELGLTHVLERIYPEERKAVWATRSHRSLSRRRCWQRARR